jgi:DNA-binding response OmpR family regulator
MSRILVMDGDPSTHLLLGEALKLNNIGTQGVQTGAEGLQIALERPPTLILIAIDLPDMSGLAVLKTLRGRTRTSHIPVMVLASKLQSSRQNEALQAGADDFLSKPLDLDLVSLRIRNAVARAERDGLHHPQTGLATGRLVQERIRALADEYGWYRIDVALDQFESFREAYGFMTGQEVIDFAAGCLSDCVRDAGSEEDFVGHRSDTEFLVVTTLVKGPQVVEMIGQRMTDGLQSFYNFMEREQGYLEVVNDRGEATRYPLMTAKIKTDAGEPE